MFRLVYHAIIITALAGSGVTTFAGEPDCVDGLCFVDRGATGEIVIGRFRGGVAVLDYDNDGFPDLVIGDNPGLTNRLMHNVPDPMRPGNRTFADVTPGSGLDDSEPLTRSEFGIVCADYDNDGDSDIFMTGTGSASGGDGLLYRNDGGGHFTNVSVSSGLRPLDHAAISASWTDFDLDGFVDLFIGDPSSLRLFRNDGDGTFTDQSGILPTLGSLGTVYAHMWSDYDADGYDDCFVLTTVNPPVLLHNVSDGAGGREFVNTAVAAGYSSLGPAPMGIAAGDFDNDGDFDFSITDASTGTYYEGLPGGVNRIFPFTTFFGWGTTWIDADNDGDLDNYQCGSHGSPNFDQFHRNLGGGLFEDVSQVLNGVSAASQHSVQIDFNNDGRPDIITLNPGSPEHNISVYENVSTTANHWFTVRVVGDQAGMNRDAIGAVVRVTAGGVTRMRRISSGTSTTSTEDLRAHFGLGSATSVDSIEVLWPRTGSIAARTQLFPGPWNVDQIVTLSPASEVPALAPWGMAVLTLGLFGLAAALWAKSSKTALT